MRLTEKYTNLVDRTYTRKPKFEKLIPGTELEDGMVVLLAPAMLKWPIEHRQERDFRDFEEVLKTNRWCTVSELEITLGVVSFIGVYEDGRKCHRSMPTDIFWLSKLDTKRYNPEIIAAERHQKIHEEICKMLQRNGKNSITELADEATANIMKLLA